MQSPPLFAHVSGQYLHFLPTLGFDTVEELQLWFQQLKFQVTLHCVAHAHDQHLCLLPTLGFNVVVEL